MQHSRKPERLTVIKYAVMLSDGSRYQGRTLWEFRRKRDADKHVRKLVAAGKQHIDYWRFETITITTRLR